MKVSLESRDALLVGRCWRELFRVVPIAHVHGVVDTNADRHENCQHTDAVEEEANWVEVADNAHSERHERLNHPERGGWIAHEDEDEHCHENDGGA